MILLSIYSISCYPLSRISRQTPNPAPVAPGNDTDEESVLSDDGTIFYDDTEADALTPRLAARGTMAVEYLPNEMSRERAKRVLKRALEIVEKRRPSSQPCRLESVDQDAKNVLKFLTGDPGIGSTDESSRSQPTSQESGNAEFCPADLHIDNTQRRISYDTMQNIVRLADQGQTEKSIKGKYKWYTRKYLPSFRKQLTVGGDPALVRFRKIDEMVDKRVDKAMDAGAPIHDYILRRWALEAADEIGDENFVASDSWILKFKKRHQVLSKAVTHYVGDAEIAKAAIKDQEIQRFLDTYSHVRQLFPHHLIVNMDQSGLNYEIANKRTLVKKGGRDVKLRVSSKSATTHSYTVQAMVGRDGTLAGKLFICFREPSGRFGTRIEPRIRRLEEDYGNIVISASKSGKCTVPHLRDWTRRVLVPEQQRRLHMAEDDDGSPVRINPDDMAAGPSWASDPTAELTEEQRNILRVRNSSSSYVARPDLMLITDSWTAHANADLVRDIEQHNIFQLTIPDGATGKLQPLDVNFFRQYKKFVKVIFEAAIEKESVKDITKRWGIIDMHSVIWNQLSAPVYRDMILWGWRNIDPEFSVDELERGAPPPRVFDVQFGLKRSHYCEVEGCSNKAILKCAHCGKKLCLEHFLKRVCFHTPSTNSTEQSSLYRRHEHDDDEDDDSDTGAGAAAAAVATGVAVGAGTGIAGASSAAGVAGTVGTSALSGSSSSSSSVNAEEIPLLDVRAIAHPEKVIVIQPELSMKDLIRSSKTDK